MVNAANQRRNIPNQWKKLPRFNFTQALPDKTPSHFDSEKQPALLITNWCNSTRPRYISRASALISSAPSRPPATSDPCRGGAARVNPSSTPFACNSRPACARLTRRQSPARPSFRTCAQVSTVRRGREGERADARTTRGARGSRKLRTWRSGVCKRDSEKDVLRTYTRQRRQSTGADPPGGPTFLY